MTEPAENLPADHPAAEHIPVAEHLIERAAALLRSVPNQRQAGGPPLADAGARPALAFPPAAAQPALVAAAHPGAPAAAVAPPRQPMVTLEAMERAGMAVARAKRTRISEEYRIVIGRVLRALHDERPPGETHRVARNALLVTSARPGEGKSFSALNLAGSIAQNAGEQVLLVDIDPKARPISDQLGLGERQGFLDLIMEPGLRPESLVLPTALPNLNILPLGTRPVSRVAASPAEDGTILRPVPPVVHRLSQAYPNSLLILDAPPCLSTSDSHTLAGHVGQIVMVVEAERTQRSEVEAALELVQVCPVITMLLNKVKLTTSHTFGAYDYFGSYT